MDGDERSDEELVGRVGEGDETAFVALYDRYFEQVYDFAIRIARDRELAALVVQSTFLRVGQGLRAGTGASPPFKVLLFATARVDLRERLRRRQGLEAEASEGYDVGDAARLSDPAFAAELPDLARGAWRAAGELSRDDYELLDLNVRRQLHAGELAAILRSRPDQVDRKLVNVSRTFEVAFAALLLYGVGRQACVDLDFVLTDDEWTPSLRRRVQRHYQSCQTCQTTRRRYPAAPEVFAALTPVLAPAGWQAAMRDRLVEALRAGTPAAPPAAVAATVPAPPPARHQEPFEPDLGGGGAGGAGLGDWLTEFFGGGGSRGPLLAVLGGGLLVFIVVIAAVCSAGAFDGDGDGGAGRTPTITPTGSITGTPGTPTDTPTPTLTPTATSDVAPTAPIPPTEPPAPTAPSPPTPTTAAPTVAAPSPTPTIAPPTPTPPPPTATSPAPPTPTTAPLPTPTTPP